MLFLSKLNSILSRVLTFPELHTAVLFTVPGDLVAYAADPIRPKDEIRIIVGLAGEIWQETKEQGYGMVESEKYGRVLVLPVDDEVAVPAKIELDAEVEPDAEPLFTNEKQPLMLLALNATEDADWDDLHEKGALLSSHLAKPLSRYRPFLTVKYVPPTPALSPAPVRPT